KHQARDNRLKFLKQDSGEQFVPYFYVNCTGAHNNGKNIITFDGGSTVYNHQGQPIFLAEKPYAEKLLVMDTKDADGQAISRAEKPSIAQKLEAIIEGLRHLKNIRGREEHQKFVIGLSGGVDSSIVAAILALAFGPDKVLGVNMPTRFNSDKTKNAARSVAEQLGIAYMEIPIEELATANEQLLEQYTPDGELHLLNPLQKGNIAAKIRGTNLLSNIAAQYGALFTNNGNKLETALGYATLYGDVGGAVAPLADLLKTEIFDLARYLNAEVFKREVIPAIVIPDELFRFTKDQIQPSAELEKEQVDPMKFGYHDALLMMMADYRKKTPEDFLQWFKEGTLHQHLAEALQKSPWWGQRLMRRWNVDKPRTFVEDIGWFASLVQQNVFKRVQAPPIIITSKSAYGYDIRESLLPWQPTQAYERLKEEVLALSAYKLAYQPEEVQLCR
ncbi:NAD(+) synthase, partial [Candidatus Woesearchaeota archaeon]|nr:NAD(+) synthase [Candidatus Woesearchaeota archaeon]